VLSISPGVPPFDWMKAYEQMLAPLPPGVYQLIVHLAYDAPEMRGATWDHPDWGAAWRQADFDLVRSEAFRNFLKAQGFILITGASSHAHAGWGQVLNRSIFHDLALVARGQIVKNLAFTT
jgi:hypothetical protein